MTPEDLHVLVYVALELEDERYDRRLSLPRRRTRAMLERDLFVLASVCMGLDDAAILVLLGNGPHDPAQNSQRGLRVTHRDDPLKLAEALRKKVDSIRRAVDRDEATDRTSARLRRLTLEARQARLRATEDVSTIAASTQRGT